MQEQFLGDYRILKQLGEGVLGNVLLAEHRFLKKQYILKVLPSELSQDTRFIERFEEEIAKLAQLDHPHIVKIHNVSFAEGAYFLVTDCVVDSFGETINLAQYLAGKKERLPEESLLQVMRQIADALDYAHRLGLAHQCLKLNNFLVGKPLGSASPTSEATSRTSGIPIFISDYGLAKMIPPGKMIARMYQAMAEALGSLPFVGRQEKYLPMPIEAEKLSRLSQSFLQNFAFLAPEQKKCEQAGVQADVFAYGILAYYLIAGHFPEGVFPMPSALAPEYHHDWDGLVTRCLHQNPQARPKELLPLLEQKKSRTETHSSEPAAVQAHDNLSTLIDSLTIPPLREALPADQPLEREEPVLKPWIQRTAEQVVSQASIQQVVAVTVTTPAQPREGLTGDSEELYTQQLSALLNREPVITQYHPEKKEARVLEPIQTDMRVIRGGQFMRGSNSGSRDEMPSHKVTLHSFAMDIHPVTNEQYLRFLEHMGGEKDHNYNDLIRLKDSRLSRAAGKLSVESGYAKHPVVGVTWYGAVAYSKWVGKRLPTEAEWEVAARGKLENSAYPTGDQIEKGQANFFSSDTTPVMSYPSNAYGLYDMAGNVYEWCQDWYGYNYYETALQEPNNPKGPPQGVYRVLRGGCWKSLHEDMRCSYRHRNNPGAVNSTYGFRCASDVY